MLIHHLTFAFTLVAFSIGNGDDGGSGVMAMPAHRIHPIARGHVDHIRRVASVDMGKEVAVRDTNEKMRLGRRQSCVLGAWQCAGQELQRCYNDRWNMVQTCDGVKTICVASNPLAAPGCVWATASVVSDTISPSPTTVVTDPIRGKSTTHVASGISTVVSSGGPTPTQSGSEGGPSGSYSNPHWSIYADRGQLDLPKSSELLPFNRFILAFWVTEASGGGMGPMDWALDWSGTPQSERDAILEDYHSNGIALMVSAFGSTDAPTTRNVDPVLAARSLASYVQNAGLDGVDLDYEDSGAFVTGTAEDWLIAFQRELRSQLPPPYLISHAPQPAYFTTTFAPKGGYKTIHEAVGDGIDFYNVQYYNQGATTYTDCNSIVTSQGGTALLEVAQNTGIPLNKLLIGKPLNQNDVSNTGVVDASTLASCVTLAKKSGWNAGAMVWQWGTGAQDFMKTVVGGG